MDRRFGGHTTHDSLPSQSSPADDFEEPGVTQQVSVMSVAAVTEGFASGDQEDTGRQEAGDGPQQHRRSPLAGTAPFPPPADQWGDANDVWTPRLASTPRHLARPRDVPLPPPVSFMEPSGSLLPDGGPRDTFDRHIQALPDRQGPTQLPSPAQLYGSGGPGGYSLPLPAQTNYGGSAYSPSYGHPPYPPPHPHLPGPSVSYDSKTATYQSPDRSGGEGHPGSSPHFRPASASWDYGYQPMASIKPPPLDTYRDVGDYHATTSPRTVNPSLSSHSSRDPFDPFIRPEEHAASASYMMSTSPHDFASASSSAHWRSHPAPAMPDPDVKMRRTSLESGARRNPQQQLPTVTSRLGLDPVAKQERRREQNRLAQRAFRARAKQREQDKAAEMGDR